MENSSNIKGGPKDFFMHLFAFGTLYAAAVSLISLWFQYINVKFPDPLQPMYLYGYEQMRVPMAVLIVVFPVFLFLARWISKQIEINPERKELRVYKWLVYFTLFISAVTVVIDLITLIYNFLGGELTARFGFKILVVLIVALGVFGYYFWHLRSNLASTGRKRSLLRWIVIVAIVGSIVLGFFIVGSPATARQQRFDQQRVSDLQNIQWQIEAAYQRNDVLPGASVITLRDPETDQLYEYRATGAKTFELCATFNLETPVTIQKDPWYHTAGRYCYQLNVESIPAIPIPKTID